MKQRTLFIITAAVCVCCFAALLAPEIISPVLTADSVKNGLILAIIRRGVLAVALVCPCAMLRKKSSPRLDGKALLWCIPCLLVCVANFPFSAIISGSAAVVRRELIPLFLANCLMIGITEEVLFRGIIFTLLDETLGKKRNGVFASVAVSAAVFGLFHLVNLADGADAGTVLLQVGYTFLLGIMLASAFIRTGALPVCIVLHTLFDVGGLLVETLGVGSPHDVLFWALTAAAGAVCAATVAIFLIDEQRKRRGENPEDVTAEKP